MEIINTQGTLLHIAPEGTDLSDIAAIETAIETTTYDAAQTWVIVPTPSNSCIIIQVVSA